MKKPKIFWCFLGDKNWMHLHNFHKIQVIFWDHPSGKHLCWSFFLTKLQAFSHETLKRDSNTAVSCEICEIFRNFFCYRTLPVAASVLLTLNFFFLAGFCFTNITNHRTAREGVGHSINSSLLFPPVLQALRH